MFKPDQEYYYYLRDRKYRPIVTVCIMRKNDEYSRGISVCSDLDIPIKKEGRRLARKRAIKALFSKKNDMYIKRYEADALMDYMLDVSFDWDIPTKIYDEFYCKSTYMPSLSVFEKILMGLIERNMN